MSNCSWWAKEDACEHPAWMVWAKRLGGGKAALLLMNNAEAPADVSVDFLADLPRDTLRCPAEGCLVRDVHAHEELGAFTRGYTAAALAAHDCAFLVVQGAAPARMEARQ